jgi:hypothetical protein
MSNKGELNSHDRDWVMQTPPTPGDDLCDWDIVDDDDWEGTEMKALTEKDHSPGSRWVAVNLRPSLRGDEQRSDAMQQFVQPAMAAVVSETMRRQHEVELGRADPTPEDPRYKQWVEALSAQSTTTTSAADTEAEAGEFAPAGHAARWENWCCSEGAAASFPTWVRTACVLSPRPLTSADAFTWGSGATAHVIVNNRGFSPRLRNLARRLRRSLRRVDLDRQQNARLGPRLEFEAAYDLMEEVVRALSGDARGLRAHRTKATALCFPAPNAPAVGEPNRPRSPLAPPGGNRQQSPREAATQTPQPPPSTRPSPSLVPPPALGSKSRCAMCRSALWAYAAVSLGANGLR